MLIITNGNQTEALLESDYEKIEERNGTLQISFSSFNFAQNVGHNLLDWEVLVEDEDGHEYKVKQFQQNSNSKSATATHIYFDLVDTRQENIFGGTRTIEQFLDFVFKGTGWSYTIDNDLKGQSQTIPNFGQANVVALINTILSSFECERKILPGKVVRFGKVIGQDNDLQYRYKYNIERLTKNIDTSSIKTQIRGYTSDRTIDVTYTSPLANHPRIGVRVADPIETDEYTTADEMRSFLATQIPSVLPEAIEISVTDIDGEVGDYVWVIHEGIDLEYQTRILSKTTKRNYADSTVTVGESTVKTVEDILIAQQTKIQSNEKLTRSKFEQTNDRITMEVEEINSSIATLEIKANSIELSVNNVQGQVSSLQVQANQIQSTVSDMQTNFSSQITQLADEIELKVSEEDYNGNEIVSKINLSSTTIDIQASKINLIGAVTVLSNITDDLGSIYAGDIHGVNIYSANINISDNVRIGNNLYLGSTSNYTSTKQITFNGSANIQGGGSIDDGWGIRISASSVEIDGDLVVNGDVDGVVKDDYGGLSITYGSSGNTITFRRNGSYLGLIKLES